MREENEEEHQQRLARMVMTRWRLPVDRRLFEEQLILSLQVHNHVSSQLTRQPTLTPTLTLTLTLALTFALALRPRKRPT